MVDRSNERQYISLSLGEKIKCLEEILSKFKKILYVYDKSQVDPNYNYKFYCDGILIFVSSSNMLFDNELVSVIVNLNAIVTNDFDKPTLKRLVFESKGQLEALLASYKHAYEDLESAQNIDSPAKGE